MYYLYITTLVGLLSTYYLCGDIYVDIDTPWVLTSAMDVLQGIAGGADVVAIHAWHRALWETDNHIFVIIITSVLT